MSRQSMDIYVEVSPAEIRAAKVDADGLMHEFLIERICEQSLVGGIYLGRVVRLEKGMEAAFVDIGLAENSLINKAKGIAEGQWVVVQVTRDARDGKGPALTLNPTLLGRYFGMTPGRKGINWARAVGKGRDRAGLETILASLNVDLEGFSIRGPATSGHVDLLIAEYDRLQARWQAICDGAKQKKAGLLEAPDSLFYRMLRDAEKETRFALDDRELHLKAKTRIAKEMPDLKDSLAFHSSPEGLFESSGVLEQLDDALSRVVELEGGGSIVFDRTEALSVIDVNMGQGAKHGDDAVFKVNRIAAEEVCRQITLRNLSGLIVIDFISMKNKNRAKKLVEVMRTLMSRDPRHTDVLGLSAAGLVEITRQREGPSLDAQMLQFSRVQISTLPIAQAAEILRTALKLKGAGRPVAYGSTLVIEALKGPLGSALEETSRRLGQQVKVRVGDDTNPPMVEME